MRGQDRYHRSDETGHEFVRYFGELRGDLKVSGAPLIRVADLQVMFQKIIYDGLVGDSFLRNFTTTYDLASSRMIFAIPGYVDKENRAHDAASRGQR